MINLTTYNDYLAEGALSSVSSFLKAQYNNIFKDPNKQLSNLFTVLSLVSYLVVFYYLLG